MVKRAKNIKKSASTSVRSKTIVAIGKKVTREQLLTAYSKSIGSKDNPVKVINLLNNDCLAHIPLHISTQSVALDKLLNKKGIPTGRITEIFGPEHIGKSTILDHIFASVQRLKGIAVLIEPEAARDTTYTRSLGVDVEKLQYINFDRENFYLENIIDVIFQTVDFWRINSPDTPVVIGLDALGGTATKDENTKNFEESMKPASAAKVLRVACRQLPVKLGNTKIAVVICNHEYQTIPIGQYAKSHRETYGGGAIRHLATLRLSLFAKGFIEDKAKNIIGRHVGARLVKNRLGNPWGESSFALLSNRGIDNVWSIYQELLDRKYIVVNGSWSVMNVDNQEVKFQGYNGFVAKCQEMPELFDKLIKIYQILES